MKAGLMLGVNPNSIREENDFYATDPFAIKISENFFKEIKLNNKLWEPACGTGHLSRALEEIGYEVYSTDLISRGYGAQMDFLQSEQKWDGDIITNPPFKIASDFIRKSMKLLNSGNKAVMFLKIQFLETPKRAKLFKECGLKTVAVFSERICCAMNGDFDKYFKKDITGRYKGGTQLYAWFVFEKDYKGNATILTI